MKYSNSKTAIVDKRILHFSKSIPMSWLESNKEFISDFIYTSNTNIDIDTIENRVDQIVSYKTQLEKLCKYKVIPQKTEEWHETRKHILTASNLALAIGQSKYGTRNKLIHSKATKENTNNFHAMRIPPIHWGNMFEPMAARCYSQKNDSIKVHEFGLIVHPTLDCFGASPDGINELGIMVEYKCPYKRIINHTIPDQYKYQILGQMAVCELQECDFVDCQFEKIYTFNDYRAIGNSNINHGIIVEYGNPDEPIFDYSPSYLSPRDAIEWLRNHPKYNSCLFHVWSLSKMNIHRDHFDEHKWNSIVPLIKDFWNDVYIMMEDLNSDSNN
jgi:putative phage-type endonuclease